MIACKLVHCTGVLCFILRAIPAALHSARNISVVLQDIGVAKTPYWLTRAFSLVERDDLTVNLDQLTTLQKVRSAPANCDGSSELE